ncbi:MAG TPA: glycosyltransferase family 4 protein [Ilumatobacteraceae bacterium]|jgi:glycosyltransferase involved in cell wall biosynthesis
MRILLIADFYWPYLGGVEQHVRSLAAALAERGHTVTVATLAKPGLPGDERDCDVRVRRLTSMTQRVPWLFTSNERPWAPPIADPAIVRQLRKVIAEERPHIVHGHDWLARSFLPLRRWSRRRFGTRYVSSLHYYTLSCARKNLMHVDAQKIETPCGGPAFGKCLRCASRHYGTVTGSITTLGNLIGAAADQRAAAVTVAVSKATAIGNGLDPVEARVAVVPNFLSPAADAAAADDGELNRLPDGDFIVFVGDLRPMKGLDVLLGAYAGLTPTMPLVLIGKSWPDTPDIPDNVLVFEKWPNQSVMEAWRRCAIGVVPSVWAEPFGIVVIEAMAGGAAVVAADVGGIPEIVEDGVSGVLVPPGDADALRDALQALVSDPLRRAELGAAAKRRAESFTATAVIPAIEDLYRRLLPPATRAASTSS